MSAPMTGEARVLPYPGRRRSTTMNDPRMRTAAMPAAGQASQAQPSRPGPVRGREHVVAERQLVVVHRAAGDAATVASGAGPEEVDLSADRAPRTPADRARCPGPRRPARPGEPALGIPADPRGAPQARDQDLRDDGPDDPPAPRPEPCSAPGGPDVDPSSCGHRQRGSGRPTSSPSRRSVSGRSTSCSSSSSPRDGCTWPA